MRDAVIAAVLDLARADPAVMLLSADLGFAVFDRFRAELPGQWLNTGVAEQTMTALACGIAMTGGRAFTYSIGNFPTLRCLEQLRNDVCYHGADVIVIAVGGGFSYGQLGMSHFATEDLAILRAIPGMAVVAPSDPWAAAELVRQLHARGGPAYLRIDKDAAGLAPAPVTLGTVREVRGGDDAVVFATGAIVREAMAAADALAGDGFAVRVVEVHTIKPFDAAGVVRAVGECRHVVTLEEHVVTGGLGSAVAEACLDAGVAPAGFARIGLRDCFPEVVGDQSYLRAAYGMDRVAVIAALRGMLEPGNLKP